MKKAIKGNTLHWEACLMSTIRTSLVVLGFFGTAYWSEPATGQRVKPGTVGSNLKDGAALAAEEEQKKENCAKKPRGKFTIGKETTYVTGPLDNDGYIDYAAALNERLRRGVTPANNANVLLWKAFGPHLEGATMPPEFFRQLGLQAPPESGEYFIDLSRYMKEHLKIDLVKGGEEINDQLSRSTQRPWTPKEYPNLASWLKANEKPLAVVVEATKRSHYFSPLVPTETEKGSPGLIGALMPGVQKCRELANALAARAMLRAGQGADDDAWRDLLACHRLARLVGRGATLIEALVGIAIDHIACRADLAFLDRRASARPGSCRDGRRHPRGARLIR